MRVTRTIEYDAALDQVHAMLTDERFHERKCVSSGAPKHDVRVEELPVEDIGTMVIVTTSRTVPTADLPGFVRNAVGETLTVEEHYEWRPLADAGGDGSDHAGTEATMTLRIAGAPVTLTGRIELAPQGPERTSVHVIGDLKASVPLMGRKIEQSVAPIVDEQLDLEERVGREWLAER